jgi:hypothetical protein
LHRGRRRRMAAGRAGAEVVAHVVQLPRPQCQKSVPQEVTRQRDPGRALPTERPVEVPDLGRGGAPPAHEGVTAWRADRLVAVRAVEHEPLARQLGEVGCVDLGLPIDGQVDPEIVDHNVQHRNVPPCLCRAASARRAWAQHRQHQGGQQQARWVCRGHHDLPTPCGDAATPYRGSY